MLQKIRSNLQGLVAYGIVGLLVVVFAFWGVEAFFLGESVVDVAEVNGETITELELNQAVYRQRQQLLARMGDQADPSQIDEAMLRGPVLEQMIGQRLLLQSAAANDLVVSETMANQYIQQQSDFQVDGVFSPERFDALIRSNGMTPARYRAGLIDDLQVTQLLTGLARSALVTPRELERLFVVMDQQRDIETAVLSPEFGRANVVLDEGEAQEYFDEHGDEFVTQEQLKVEFIEMRLEDFYPTVSEDAIVAAYQANAAQFVSSTRRRAAHILLDEAGMSEEEAMVLLTQLADRLAQGESFAELASEYSEDIGSNNNGGDVGFTDGSAFPEAFEQALVTLEVGQVSAPVRSDAGWHLIKLTDIEGAEAPALDVMRETIRAQLQQEKAEPAYAVKLEELKDISFNAADLASVAQALALEVSTSDFFGRDGATEGMFADQRVLGEAFSSNVITEAMNSDVVELSPGHAVVLRLVEQHQPEPMPYEEVASVIEERLLAQKSTAYLQKHAQEIEKSLAEGQKLADLSDDEAIEYQAYAQLSRNNLAGVDAGIIAAAFRLSPPSDDRPSVVVESLPGGSVAVIVLNKVEPGSLDDFDEEKRNNMQQALSRYRTERVVEGYRSALQQEADIEIL
jgi:peptidyl-prolyl cis-trans isomerase D